MVRFSLVLLSIEKMKTLNIVREFKFSSGITKLLSTKKKLHNRTDTIVFYLQLISKELFGIYPQFFQKTNAKKFDLTTMIPQVDLFSFVFGGIWRYQEDISKLTDLYQGKKYWWEMIKGKNNFLRVNPWKFEQKNVLFGCLKYWTKTVQKQVEILKFIHFIYRTRAIITRGLYTFYPLYVLWPLALCMVCIQERFLIKSGL